MLVELYNHLLTFIFVFSLLAVVRTIFKFISSLLSNPPKPLVLTTREIVFNGIFLSYVITFIIALL